jgi:menaquinone reductase, multiheme cytochrome c subunit
MTRSAAAFGLGVATMLAAGWFAFPRALYVRQEQPRGFRHKIHAEKSGISQCGDCHTLHEDGTFTGIPSAETCATCHSEPMAAQWLVYSRQAANVWFSHAIHLRLAKLNCTDCHGAYGDSAQRMAYQQDRISGYSRSVMPMSQCEGCHRQRKIEVGCLGCHK